MMQHSEGQFDGADGHNIYYQVWTPEGEPRALILIAHGAAEHSGRYQRFAEHFTGLGYALAGLDHIGHGKSDGKRCCIRSFRQHLDTLEVFRARLREQFPDLPMFLLGHSMGGLIASNFLLEQQGRFAGCILSGPAIKADFDPPWYQFLLIRIFAAIAPDMGMLQLDAAGVSRDPEEVDRYVSDPLNYTGKLTARMILELFRAMESIQSRAAEVTLPLLILHGGEDSMASPEGSRLLHEKVGSEDNTLKIYPGLYHEIFNEPERLQVYGDIERWLDARL